MTIRVLLVDDDALVRQGLALMLGTAADLTVIGEAGDGDEAVRLAGSLRPDVVLMDIRMPGTDGVTATRRIRAEPDPPHVVALTTFDADELVRAAIGAGADGYLVKDTPPGEIIAGVRAVASGQGVLSPSATRPLLDMVSHAAAPTSGGLEVLTEREREVALAVAAGATNTEIAEQLYVSVATVKAAVSRILTKLDLTNRVQIAVIVRDAGV